MHTVKCIITAGVYAPLPRLHYIEELFLSKILLSVNYECAKNPLCGYGCEQLINEPTRVTKMSKTLIDHVFTSIPHKVRNTKVPWIEVIDHYSTCIVLKDLFGCKHIGPTNYLTQTSKLHDIIVQQCCRCDHNNDSLDTWQSMLNEVKDRHLQ